MKTHNEEIEYLKNVISSNQEKLIGEILHHIKIYEIKDVDFEKMKTSVEEFSKETFRILKAIESQKIIEEVLTSKLK
jgi:hypothetical protein